MEKWENRVFARKNLKGSGDPLYRMISQKDQRKHFDIKKYIQNIKKHAKTKVNKGGQVGMTRKMKLRFRRKAAFKQKLYGKKVKYAAKATGAKLGNKMAIKTFKR